MTLIYDNMKVYRKEDGKVERLTINSEEKAINPRIEGIGTIISFDSNHPFGDETYESGALAFLRKLAQKYAPEEKVNTMARENEESLRTAVKIHLEKIEIQRLLEVVSKTLVVAPIYLHADNEGITINTTGFSNPSETKHVGYIYETKENLSSRVSTCKNNKRRLYMKILNGEVERYDAFINQDIYGYKIEEAMLPKNILFCPLEEIDISKLAFSIKESCMGYFGNLFYLNRMAQDIPEWEMAIRNNNRKKGDMKYA